MVSVTKYKTVLQPSALFQLNDAVCSYGDCKKAVKEGNHFFTES